MKLSRKTALLATAALMTQIATAQALDFTWSWESSTNFLGPFDPPTLVSGTVSGLVDNTPGQGLGNELSIVLNSPVGPVTGWSFFDAPLLNGGFDVENGAVVGFNIKYAASNADGDYFLYFGDNSFYYPELLFNPNTGSVGTIFAALPPPQFDIAAEGGATNFTPAPEPASLALLGAGLAGLGFARRRRG